VRPGVNIIQKETRPPLALPTESSVFMIGVTEKGPLAPVVSKTPTQWTNNHGARTTTTSTMADAAEFLFKEGAKRIITSRVVGPGAVTASVNVTRRLVPRPSSPRRRRDPARTATTSTWSSGRTSQDANIPAGSFVLRIQTR
jgi:hypothetical protein